MIVWRISKNKYASTTFEGIGAQKVGGRFNHPGSPKAVYSACDCLSLALVELWVHLPTPKTPPNCSYIRAEIPDQVSRTILTEHDLPINWAAFPHPESTRDIGTEWLLANKSCLLIVPSAVTPVDHNCIINPAHPDFRLIAVAPPMPIDFDKRLTN